MAATYAKAPERRNDVPTLREYLFWPGRASLVFTSRFSQQVDWFDDVYHWILDWSIHLLVQ
jgi:hypothetical protein